MAVNGNWLKPLDRMPLQHCEEDVLLQQLLQHVPPRDIVPACRPAPECRALLAKRGQGYRTIERGRRLNKNNVVVPTGFEPVFGP